MPKPEYSIETKKTDNTKFPVAFRVVDRSNRPLVAHSGLFGWGWCSSKENALQHAGLPTDAVITERRVK